MFSYYLCCYSEFVVFIDKLYHVRILFSFRAIEDLAMFGAESACVPFECAVPTCMVFLRAQLAGAIMICLSALSRLVGGGQWVAFIIPFFPPAVKFKLVPKCIHGRSSIGKRDFFYSKVVGFVTLVCAC